MYAKKDDGNSEDRCAVAVVRNSDVDDHTVGHLPRELSHVLWHFLNHGGDIQCEVTGRRQRSSLAQGGLEIPCSVKLCGLKKMVAIARDIVIK